METMLKTRVVKMVAAVAAVAMTLTGCANIKGAKDGSLPSAQFVTGNEGPGPDYIVGPLDALQIFVWRNPEVSASVTVRPDGRLTVPLIEDLPATGRTPSQLARDIEKKLGVYIQNPIVTVMVNNFSGPFATQVRIVGQAAHPQAIPYRANMTLLDVMIAVGGLTDFAAGNSATLVRNENGTQKEYRLKINSLLKDGNVKANVAILPGDVIIVPESFF